VFVADSSFSALGSACRGPPPGLRDHPVAAGYRAVQATA
jgi:hypothetical protein